MKATLLSSSLLVAIHLLGSPALGSERTIDEESKLLGDGNFQDGFGLSTDINSSTIVVGAERSDNPPFFSSGAAFVYERETSGAWARTARLVPSDVEVTGAFGERVGVSGDWILVGDPNNSDPLNSQGAVYVFEGDGLGNWTEVQKLTEPKPAELRQFGTNLDLAEHVAAITITGFPSSDPSAVYLFRRDELTGVWQEEDTITEDDLTDPADCDRFDAIALHEDTLAVIVDKSDCNGAPTDDAVYLFGPTPTDPGQWVQTAKLSPSGGSELGNGISESIIDFDGETLIVGTEASDGAYIFHKIGEDPEVWDEEIHLQPGLSFFTVAVSGDRALIGFQSGMGRVEVYERHEGAARSWGFVTEFTGSDSDDNDRFGRSVSVDRGRMVVSANLDEAPGFESGSAYAFRALSLAATGTCPGTVHVQAAGATPGGQIAIARALALGSTTLPGGGCLGTEIDLDTPRLLAVLEADSDGEASVSGAAPLGACDSFLQAIDLVSCEVANVTRIP